RRPLLIGGIGLAADGQAAEELQLLAEGWGCPVMVTSQVKGCFPEDHPLFAGTFGMYRDEPLHALIEAADLVVAVGLDGVDFFKRWRSDRPVLSLAPEGADDPTYRPAIAVEGRLPGLLRAVAEARQQGSDWSLDDPAASRAGIEEIVRPKLDSAPDGN